MPWHIEQGHSECPSSEPFAVVRNADGAVEGCHGTRDGAEDQLAALYASETVETRANGDESNLDTPDAGDLNTAARREAASRGWAMDDGSYPIRPSDMHGRADLEKAIRAVGRGGGSHDAIRRHIMKRARALGLSEMIPDNWSGEGGLQGEHSALSAEVIERADSVLDDVRFKDRIIDVVAVPWGQEAEVLWRSEIWREMFERGAFNGIEGHAGRYPVNREHMRGDTVGRVVRFDPYNERGLIASARISKTPRGDDTLELAADGVLGASVGYFVKRGSDFVANTRTKLRTIKRAFIHHLAMTESPSFDDAMPVAVREGPSAQGAAGEPLPPRPELEAVMFDDVLRWANERVNRRSS